MSLKVWLPLDGDLRNLGASDVEVTNNGATIDDNGKIGKCYYFNNSVYLKESNYDWSNFNTSQFSLCCWYKEPSPVASGNSQIIAIGTNSGWNNIRIGLLRRTSNGYPLFTISDGSTAIQYNFTATTFSLDNWNHIAVTYNNGELKIYLNGSLDKTGTTTIIPVLNNSQHLGIGAASNGAEKLTGYLNDVRIYDHCLSAAEVHEIAQGLVLHYKLNGNGFDNENIIKNSKLDGSWEYPTSSYSDKYSPITTIIPTASQYTLSFEAKSTVAGDKMRTHYYSPNTTTTCISSQGVTKTATDGNMDFTLSTEWKKYWVIYNQSETTAVKHVICPRLLSGQGTGIVSVRNVKLEEGNKATNWCPNIEDNLYNSLGLNNNIITDSSGYNHNGETINEIIISSDTPRYTSSTKFNGSNAAIKVTDNTWMAQGAEAITINLWAKSSAWTGAHLFSCTESGGFNTETGNSGYLRFPIHVYTNAEKTSTTYMYDSREIEIASLSTTDWNMLTFVYDLTGTRTYINGELHYTYAHTSYGIHFNTNARLFLGCEAGGASPTTPYFNGQISDFRIYYTALLDNDIKLLYNMGMKIDNSQNLHTFEYKENTSNLFRSELIIPWAKADRTRIGEIVEHNDTYALNIAPEPFYKNIDSSTSGALNGSFAANTSYVFDMWIDTDSVIYNNNNVAGGMTIRYSDNSTDNTFVFTGGNKGYQHKVLITPSNKTVQRLEFYYYTSTDVFYRIDSCICPLSNLKLHKTGIFEGTNLLEETNTKLIKNALIETNGIIEM